MDEEPNPIRDIIYQKLHQLTEKKIQEQFLQGNGSHIITEIITDCKKQILSIAGDEDEKIGTMATILMHYLCTCLLVPTQRKTFLDEIYIDLVIPDTKTLKINWNSSIVLCILTSTQKDSIEKRISDAKKVQPNHKNIWLVSPRHINTPYKTFVVDSQNSFSDIIYHINQFLDKNKSGKFKIFKTV